MNDLISRQDAIDIADEIIARDTSGNNDVVKAMEAWKVSIKFLPSAQQWIPCSERLPEESGRYLISVLDGVGRRTTVAPYQPRYKAWAMAGRMAYWKVIAWMPLPEPWKGEANE